MRRARSAARLAFPLVALAIVATACGDEDVPAGPTSPAPSVTAERADTAIAALCEIETAADLEPARVAFYDRAHATLHDIAAEAAAADPGSDAELLIAKQRVEAALEEPELPPGFDGDVAALRVATTEVLDEMGLVTPPCDGAGD